VEDNGPGIPPAEREQVFQPFYRALGTDVDGSGLGLAIVKEIAERHGATVDIENAWSGGPVPRVSARHGVHRALHGLPRHLVSGRAFPRLGRVPVQGTAHPLWGWPVQGGFLRLFLVLGAQSSFGFCPSPTDHAFPRSRISS
jgi:hypothetical protein